jgi:hypothetical protein
MPEGAGSGSGDALEPRIVVDSVPATMPVDPSHAMINVGDADADGILDVAESALGTDPQDVDSDNDGIVDGMEQRIGTDPMNADTDTDSYGDYAEIVAGTDPTDSASYPDEPVPTYGPSDPYGDQDGDGITDAAEWAAGTNPVEGPGQVATGPDTDDDFLSDEQELALGTNAANPDTDRDGFIDGFEVHYGTDPTQPAR